MEHEFSPSSALPSKSSSPLSNTQPGPVMLLRTLYAFSHLILTQHSEVRPILIPILEMRKHGYTPHTLLFQDHGADKMWLKSKTFKPEHPTRTNINPLDNDPSSLHCVDRCSLTGSFSFQGIESGA